MIFSACSPVRFDGSAVVDAEIDGVVHRRERIVAARERVARPARFRPGSRSVSASGPGLIASTLAAACAPSATPDIGRTRPPAGRPRAAAGRPTSPITAGEVAAVARVHRQVAEALRGDDHRSRDGTAGSGRRRSRTVRRNSRRAHVERQTTAPRARDRRRVQAGRRRESPLAAGRSIRRTFRSTRPPPVAGLLSSSTVPASIPVRLASRELERRR